MKDSHFDNILNDCLERLADGETVSDCLARYPEHADELAPLLRMAETTTQVSRAAIPSAAGKARGMAKMQDALAKRERRKRFRLPLPAISWRTVSAPIMAAFAVVFLVIVAAGGTTVASANSIPGEPLYTVKSMRETVEERFARSDESKAHIHAKHARERGREMRELIERGRIHEAEVVSFRLQHHLNESANYIGVVVSSHFIEMPIAPAQPHHQSGAVALKQRLSHDEAYVKGQLVAIIKHVPEPHKRRVWRLAYRSDMGYKVVIVALDGSKATSASGYFIIGEAELTQKRR